MFSLVYKIYQWFNGSNLTYFLTCFSLIILFTTLLSTSLENTHYPFCNKTSYHLINVLKWIIILMESWKAPVSTFRYSSIRTQLKLDLIVHNDSWTPSSGNWPTLHSIHPYHEHHQEALSTSKAECLEKTSQLPRQDSFIFLPLTQVC